MRLAFQHKFDFFMSALEPSIILPFARTLDTAICSAAELIFGFSFPPGSAELGRLRLPLKLNGGGLRSLVEVAPCAFLG